MIYIGILALATKNERMTACYNDEDETCEAL